MNERRLIVNADDIGLVTSVNRGIVRSIEQGIVTSTSLLVNMPGTDDAIERLDDLRQAGIAVSVGLHFNIVAGTPLSRCQSLMDSGTFLPLATLGWRVLTGAIRMGDVEGELEAQLMRASERLSSIGLRVTHIDSHRHTHCLPGIFDVVLRVAERHGIGHVRHPSESRHTLLGRPRAIVASRLLRVLLTRRKPPDDIRFSGIALMASPTVDADLAMLLSVLPAGTTELMVHPGYDSSELAALDGYRAPRERELLALTSAKVRDRIEEGGITLTRFV